MNALVATAPRSVLTDVAHRYGMEPEEFEKTLRATVVPAQTSREQFGAFLVVANEYKLNPLTKEIYAFPAKGGGIVPIVSVDGWARIINDHPAFDGMDFQDVRDGDTLAAITCRMHRKDRSHPIETTEYLVECLRPTDVWRQWPRRMLRHKAMIQCARMAFGFSGVYDQDEYERMTEPPVKQVRTLHAGFEAPAPPEPEPAIEAEFEDAPTLGVDVLDWAAALNRALGAFDDIGDLRHAWGQRKAELKAASPEMFSQLNQAVAAHAQSLTTAP